MNSRNNIVTKKFFFGNLSTDFRAYLCILAVFVVLYVVQMLVSVAFWTTGQGGLERQWHRLANDTTASVVCDIIAVLERSTSSLSKGVMVVTEDWSRAPDDVPRLFLRTLHGRLEQPVYTADVRHLLTAGRPPNDTDGDPENGQAAAAAGHPVPAPCRRPTAFADRDGRALLLPLRSRYVVLFWGPGPPPGPLDALSALSYTFWDVNVYYVIVVPAFGRHVRRTVYNVWRKMSIYKYALAQGLCLFRALPSRVVSG